MALLRPVPTQMERSARAAALAVLALVVGLAATAAPLALAETPPAPELGVAVALRTPTTTPPMAPAPAPASNMAFSCSVDFPTVPGFENIYLVAVPGFFGQADIAATGDPNPCQPVSGMPDGIINADDVLCEWWSSRAGSMTISRRDEPTETWQSRMASRDDVTGDVTFTGGWIEELIANEAFHVTVTPPVSGPVQNSAVIVGSHDPAHAGHVLSIPPSGQPLVTLLNVPYHTMYERAVEFICGLVGVDYADVDRDGLPDGGYCPQGLFSPGDGGSITVGFFDNVPDGNGTDNTWVTFTATPDPAPPYFAFSGTNFAPGSCGSGYLITITPPHAGATFLSPHY